MKIAYDLQSTLGHKTGLGYYTDQLVTHVKKIAPTHEFFEINTAKRDYNSLGRIFYDQITFRQQLNHYRDVDLIHKTAFSPLIKSPVKQVVTVPDLIGMLFPENFGPLARFFWSQYLPFTFKRADFIITISEATRRDVVRLLNYPEDKIKNIYIDCRAEFQIIENPTILETVRQKYHFPDKFILFVGTFEPRKNLKNLVEAFARVKNELPDYRLVIVGKKGWGNEALFTRVKELNLESEIIFPGYVDDADMPGIYNLATMLVFPTFYEGFGLPVLEAMRCGVPVITSNNSSLPEVVGESEVLINPENVDDIVQAVIKVAKLGKSERENFTQKGLKQASQFSWEKCARETLKVYEEFVLQYKLGVSPLSGVKPLK